MFPEEWNALHRSCFERNVFTTPVLLVAQSTPTPTITPDLFKDRPAIFRQISGEDQPLPTVMIQKVKTTYRTDGFGGNLLYGELKQRSGKYLRRGPRDHPAAAVGTTDWQDHADRSS